MRRILSTLSLYLAAVYASPKDVQQSWSTDALRVPVTLGVMSRCPDALLCETLFDKVIPRVAEKIDLSLAYVAKCAKTYSHQLSRADRLTLHNRLNASDPDFGVTCLHGREECAGNVQQLCVAKYTPMRTWWEFVMCQNYQGRNGIGRSDVALKCARTAKIDWEGSAVGQCVGSDGNGTGEEGVRLLRDSIQVAESLGITCASISPLPPRCVHAFTLQQELHRCH
jgi:hypothetical protein